MHQSRRQAEMTAELRNGVEIGLLRRWREIADRHVLDHPPTEEGSSWPSGAPVLKRGDATIPILSGRTLGTCTRSLPRALGALVGVGLPDCRSSLLLSAGAF